MNEIVSKFIDAYEKGHFLSAMQLILPHAQSSYDNFDINDPVLQALINYVDASVFKGPFDAYKANLALQRVCKSANAATSFVESSFLDLLKWDEIFLHEFMNQESFDDALNIAEVVQRGMDEEKKAHFQKIVPSVYLDFLQAKSRCLKSVQLLQSKKPLFYELLCKKDDIKWHFPWHFFSYSGSKAVHAEGQIGETPCIFLEPVTDCNYREALKPYLGKKLIFLFETRESFFQFFQFEELISILLQPEHVLYIQELYPQEQLEEQENADALYRLSKNKLFETWARRYGKKRLLAYKISDGYERLVDPHKGAIQVIEDLHFSRKFLQEIVDYYAHIKKKSTSPVRGQAEQKKKKIHVAHIVAQLVDGEHPLTRLLRELISFADLNTFSLSVISTERLVPRLSEYPFANYLSEPSHVRAADTIKDFERRGVRLFLDEANASYTDTVDATLALLEKEQVDIAIFHGHDELNTLISSYSNVPCKVLFDHGSLPALCPFDLVIFSSPVAAEQAQREKLLQDVQFQILPFCVDARTQWEEKPFSKTELGFPEDSFIMTTISNHLDSRLSEKMCQAISEILKRCPKAYYAPIGAVQNPERLNALFTAYGVNERVKFLGLKPNPSQYARSMELYLNEFPFGGGLALLDAMAAGLPVVSMYDPNGPLQASYGGTYFGKDYVITSCKEEDYVNLACQLIQEPDLYRKWSEHALKQYALHSDVRRYVHTFEEMVQSAYTY